MSVLIWTTTPWTIPSNLAIAFHPEFRYAAYDVDGTAVIVAKDLAERGGGRRRGGPSETPLVEFDGTAMERLAFRHPLYERDSLGVLADYVTLEAGTGAVHTAPGHGADDYKTGVKYGLEILAPLDAGGHFVETVGLFGGLQVFDANPKVEAALKDRGRLWHREDYDHSYPHCWRCHNPVIFLATAQWFIAMESKDLRARALQEIRGPRALDPVLGPGPYRGHDRQPARLVHLAPARLGCAHPGDGLHELRDGRAHLGARRAGGDGVRRVRRRCLVRAPHRGVRARRASPAHRAAAPRSNARTTSSTSGSTRARATRRCCPSASRSSLAGGHLPRGQRPASRLVPQLAARGHRHARARARSTRCSRTASSWTSRAARCRSRSATRSRRRTSSSRAARRSCGCGSRWWTTGKTSAWARRSSPGRWRRIARSATSSACWSPTCTTSIRSWTRVPRHRMLEIDRWALAKYAECADRIVTAYDDYDYPAIFQAANTFITVDLSAFYVDVTKDRMYTFGAKSEARRSGQTAMLAIVDGLARLLAPVLSVTMDELWRTLPGKRLPSVHMAVFPMGDEIAGDRNPDLLARWTALVGGSRRGEPGARAEAAGAGHQGEPLGAGAARGRR